MEASYTADFRDWTGIISVRDQYNLIPHQEDRERYPLCMDQGVRLIPWSPLARDRLAGAKTDGAARSTPLAWLALPPVGGGLPARRGNVHADRGSARAW